MRRLLYAGRIALAFLHRGLLRLLLMVCCRAPPSQHYVNISGVFCVPPPKEETFEILNDCAAGFNVCF
jgi:hypothetical protein